MDWFCRNRLTIKGPEARECGASLRGPAGAVDFETIIPIPAALKRLVVPRGEPAPAASLAAEALNETGYADTSSFCLAKWGNEDNAIESEVRWVQPECFIARFETVYDTPLYVIAELARRNPALTVTIEYWEDCMNLTGMTEWAGGVQVYEESLDLAGRGPDEEEYLRGWVRNGVEMSGNVPGHGPDEDLEFLPKMFEFGYWDRRMEEDEQQVAALIEQTRLVT